MIVKVFQSFLQVLQKLFYQILQPSEGIVIKTPRARIWNVLAANFSQEMKEILKFLQINWGISK